MLMFNTDTGCPDRYYGEVKLGIRTPQRALTGNSKITYNIKHTTVFEVISDFLISCKSPSRRAHT